MTGRVDDNASVRCKQAGVEVGRGYGVCRVSDAGGDV
jgi:hypothetical protein